VLDLVIEIKLELIVVLVLHIIFLIVLLVYKLLHFGLILNKMFQFDSLGNNVKRVFVDDFGYNFDNVSVDYYFSNEV
jgi:hypothetical protein